MNETMKSLVVDAPNRLSLEERPIPILKKARDVLIRVEYAALCHTDMQVMSGEFPGAKYPTVAGHEFSGIVEKVGSGVSHVKPGDRVSCLGYYCCGTCPACRHGRHVICENFRGVPYHIEGAFQEYFLAGDFMVFPFGEDLSLEEAALTEPAACGYTAVERSNMAPGETIAVVGAGAIGMMIILSAKLRTPQKIIAIDPVSNRLKMAYELGATHSINIRETDAFEAVMDLTDGHGVDVAYYCAPTEDAWHLGGKILNSYGRMVIEATPPKGTQWTVPVLDFVPKVLSYIGVSGYNAAHFQATLELMENKAIDVSPLITHKFRLEDYKQAFIVNDQNKNESLKILFDLTQAVS
jgi:L-iditol 2-dehydrogenase